MKYDRISEAVFRKRPNRFVAEVERGGKTEICHVKNTGRCRELLIPGAAVYVQESINPSRKTRFDLIGVRKGERLVNLDSQIPNGVVREWLEEGNLFEHISLLRPETRYGNSRFDLYLEAGGQKIFIEVKGVTLEEEGVARFPDAPTERGLKHIQELTGCVREGYEAYVIFVIQMKGVYRMEPNDRMHPAFGEALRGAAKAGVHILAYDCLVETDSIRLDAPVPVAL